MVGEIVGDQAAREAFVSRYMKRSNVAEYRIDGDRVHYAAHSRYALPCRCGDEACEGWAMVPVGGKWFHLLQNGLADLTFDEVMQRDDAEYRAAA